MKDVSPGQRILAFHVERRDHLAMDDRVPNVRGLVGYRVDATVGELVFDRIPMRIAERVRY